MVIASRRGAMSSNMFDTQHPGFRTECGVTAALGAIHKLLTGNFISFGWRRSAKESYCSGTTDAILSPENRRIYLSLSGDAAGAAEGLPGPLRRGILCHADPAGWRTRSNRAKRCLMRRSAW